MPRLYRSRIPLRYRAAILFRRLFRIPPRVPPGTVYATTEPERVGPFPVRQDIPVGTPLVIPLRVDVEVLGPDPPPNSIPARVTELRVVEEEDDQTRVYVGLLTFSPETRHVIQVDEDYVSNPYWPQETIRAPLVNGAPQWPGHIPRPSDLSLGPKRSIWDVLSDDD